MPQYDFPKGVIMTPPPWTQVLRLPLGLARVKIDTTDIILTLLRAGGGSNRSPFFRRRIMQKLKQLHTIGQYDNLRNFVGYHNIK